MPQSYPRNFGLPYPASPEADTVAHERRWLAHVRAGRIGAPAIPAEHEQNFLLRMAEMERAVLGEVRSVKRVLPEVR